MLAPTTPAPIASGIVDLTPFRFERIAEGNLIRRPNGYAIGGGLGRTLWEISARAR